MAMSGEEIALGGWQGKESGTSQDVGGPVRGDGDSQAFSTATTSVDSGPLLHEDFVEKGRGGNEYLVVGETQPLLAAQSEEPALGDSAKSSVFHCILNLVNTIIGAGVLSLPFVFSLVGYGGGLILLACNAVGADYSLYLLIRSSAVCERKTYEGIATLAFGKKGLYIVSTCVLLLNIGAATAYVVIIGDTLPDIFHFISEDFLDPDWARLWCTSVVTMALLYPSSWLRSVSSLAIGSGISLMCVIAFVLTMFGLKISPRQPSNIDPTAPPAQAFITSAEVFRAFSVLAFSFTCHTTMFPIYLELRKPTPQRMMRVVHTAMAICILLYSTVGVCGYLDYSQVTGGVRGDVLVNIAWSESEVVALVVQIMYLISIIATFPLALPPMRQAITALAFNNAHPTKWSTTRHIVFSSVCVVLAYLLGSFVPVLEFVFGLTGATAGVTLVYILPTAMALRVCSDSLALWNKILLWAICLVGIAIGGASTVFTVLDFIESNKSE
eukprot:m.361944 g.361944  ORF g.361944 m.361944 type:complete len:497 (+) comp20013_c0_seq1:238-1728(+)